MPPIEAAALARIERELERIGLLFEHDREYPSFTCIAAGEPIRGSWWGHARGHDIYAALEAFEEGAGALSAKLVNGKITYVHARLWPAFLAVAHDGVAARRARLSPLARALAEQIEARGLLRATELAGQGMASAAELNAAFKELGDRLLVRAGSEHTASGAHARTAESWTRFCERRGYACPPRTPIAARDELFEAARELTRGSARTPKLAWD